MEREQTKVIRKWYNFYLDMDDVRMRELRRLLIIFVLGGVITVVNNIATGLPIEYGMYLPLLTAIAAALDKMLRDYKK